MNRPFLSFRQISRCGHLRTPLLLSSLFLLKISSSRTCSRTVRLVIFTTDLHGVVTLRENIETVAPLPTVDVMAVIVLTTTVTTVSAHGAQRPSHQNQRKETAQTIAQGQTCAADTQNQHYRQVLTVVDTGSDVGHHPALMVAAAYTSGRPCRLPSEAHQHQFRPTIQALLC